MFILKRTKDIIILKAHFPNKSFIIVTKEGNDNPPKHYKPAKIPHICIELGIEWMDDFDFLKEVGITFDSSKFLKNPARTEPDPKYDSLNFFIPYSTHCWIANSSNIFILAYK